VPGLDFGRLRVLIVDDNAFSRRIALFALRALNIQSVAEAESAESGYAALKSFGPDLILVDWVMRPIDGLAFIKRVRADKASGFRYVPIIMVSGFSEIWRVRQARDTGANEYVVKPFSAKILYTKLRTLIDVPRPFIEVPKGYFGPDRRRHDQPFAGLDRRATNKAA
jgi:CheY-like chemotaxis protein